MFRIYGTTVNERVKFQLSMHICSTVRRDTLACVFNVVMIVLRCVLTQPNTDLEAHNELGSYGDLLRYKNAKRRLICNSGSHYSFALCSWRVRHSVTWFVLYVFMLNLIAKLNEAKWDSDTWVVSWVHLCCALFLSYKPNTNWVFRIICK